MAEGKQGADWNRTADQMAQAANLNRKNPGDYVFQRKDFHPLLTVRKPPSEPIRDPKVLALEMGVPVHAQH